MKKDPVIAIIIIVIVFGAMFGVAQVRVPVQLRPSHPFVAGETATMPGITPPPTSGHVVMHVNGEAVTEEEFDAAFSGMPTEMQQQFASAQGKQAFAEEIVKVKLLEQEARKKGLDKDPHVAGAVSFEQAQMLANAAVQKLVSKPSEAAVKKFYDDNKDRLVGMDLYGIVVAVQGGTIPPKNGGQPPTQEQAMQRAAQIAQQLQKGADFGQMAKQYSDDPTTAARGGYLGPVAPGALPPELDARIFSMRKGEILGPVPSRMGIYVFKAGEKKVQPLEGELRQRIEQNVQQQETKDKIDQLRKFAKVDFDPKFFPTPKGAVPPPPQAPGAR